MLRGAVKSVSFWGLIVIILALVLKTFVGLDNDSAQWMAWFGFALIAYDWLKLSFDFARWQYRSEQDELVRKLKD